MVRERSDCMGLMKYWRILQTLDQPAKFVFGRILQKLHVSHLLKVKQDGYVLRFYPASMCETRWLKPTQAHRPVEEFFRRYVKPGDTVVDAGANVGVFTLVASIMTGKTGKVYCMEPHPRTFGFLQGHMKTNAVTNVKAFNVALGDKDGTITFSNSRSDDQNCVVDKGPGITVPVARLDALGIDEPVVAFLKIDVEGYEKFVLAGAVNLLPRVQCMLFEFEEDHYEKFGYSCHDLLAIIRGHGFRILRIVDNECSFIPQDYSTHHGENLVGVRDVNDFIGRTGYQLRDSTPLDIPSLHPH